MSDIDRRDFLNGVALTVGASAIIGTGVASLSCGGTEEAAREISRATGFYPPSLTGMRGSHDGSYDVMHSISWGGEKFGRAETRVDADYDLIVVGGGLSGLAAARYFQQKQPDARILILDNHDDFGGHARRNEFTVDGHQLVGHGGSQSIDTPSSYSKQAADLLKDIGIETDRFYDYFDRDFYPSHEMAMGLFLPGDHFGQDHLQKAPVELFGGLGLIFGGAEMGHDDPLIATLPIANEDKAMLRELIFEAKDYLPNKNAEQKIDILKNITYTEYLRKQTHASETVIALLDKTFTQLFALNWEAMPAINAIDVLMPGTQGLGLGPGGGFSPRLAARARTMLPLAVWRFMTDSLLATQGIEPYVFHFPDGNASIARLMIRKMIPSVVSGNTMEDIVLAPLDYARLDMVENKVRCRLNATVVDVRHNEDQSGVDVSYISNGEHLRISGSHVILACNHQVIPYICEEMPEEQKAAQAKAMRAPLCYINVALRNWRAFKNAGVHRIYAPKTDLPHMLLDFPVSMGGVAFSPDPDQPIVLHISYAPSSGLEREDKSHRELFREGQHVVYGLSFEDFEMMIKKQLNAMLGPYGFEADRDIAAITVNRWTHGYAYTPYGDGGEPAMDDPNSPNFAARAQNYRISIANSDAEYDAYVDNAFDAAWRAVEEQNALVTKV
jgi:spermidine dehydrogenase